jgi:hypothetical protein
MGSGFFFPALWLGKRSDLIEEFDNMMGGIRANPNFQHLGHKIFQWVKLDLDGPWRVDAERWIAMGRKWGFVCEYASPDKVPKPYGAAHAEAAILQIERVGKSLLYDKALPAPWIQRCVNAGITIKNVVPIASKIVQKDGDAPRPLQEITGNRVSMRQCNNVVHHFLGPGTLCLVYDPKVKGSNVIDLKGRWGAVTGMNFDLPVFECPWTGVAFRSKNYYVHDLPPEMNFYQVLGITPPDTEHKPPKRGREAPPADTDTIIVIKGFSEWIRADRAEWPTGGSVLSFRGMDRPAAVIVVDKGTGARYTADEIGKFVEMDEPVATQAEGAPEPRSLEEHPTAGARAKLPRPPATAPSPDSSTEIVRDGTPRRSRGPAVRTLEDLLYISPKTFINERFARRFNDGKVYDGYVTGCKEGASGTEWTVRYDADGVEETFEPIDMKKHVIDKNVEQVTDEEVAAIEPRELLRWKVSLPKRLVEGEDLEAGVATAAERPTPGAGVPPSAPPPGPPHKSLLEKIPCIHHDGSRVTIFAERTVRWNTAELIEHQHPLIEVAAGETWSELRDRMGLLHHQERMYLNWLGRAYGGKASYNPEPGHLGCRFRPKWQGGRRNTPLRVGAIFPSPEGSSWEAWEIEYKRAQDTTNGETVNAALVRDHQILTPRAA